MAKRCRSCCGGGVCGHVTVPVVGCGTPTAFPVIVPVTLKLGAATIGVETINLRVSSITLGAAGNGYVGIPAVAIAAGGGSGAVAVAVLTTAAVAGVALVGGGAGYVTAPAVTLGGGGGAGATVTARLNAGAVVSLVLTSGGGYTPGTGYALGFAGGGGSGAAGTFDVDSAGRVSGIALTAGGSGYTSAPSVTFPGTGSGASAIVGLTSGSVSGLALGSGSGYTPGTGYSVGFNNTGTGGSGAAGTFDVDGDLVTNLQLTSGGSAYFTAPAISFPGAGGSGATGSAGLTPGPVAGLTLGAAGSGYSSNPTLTIAPPPPGGTTATGTATIATRSVASISVTDPGSNFTSTPTVTIDPPPSGVTATGTAVMGTFAWFPITATGTYTATATAPGDPWWDPAPVSRAIVVSNCAAGGSGQINLVAATGYVCRCSFCRDPTPEPTITVTDSNGTYTATFHGTIPGWACCYSLPGQTIYTFSGGICQGPTSTGSVLIGYQVFCPASGGGMRLRQVWSGCDSSHGLGNFSSCSGDVVSGGDPRSSAPSASTFFESSSGGGPNNCNTSATWSVAGGYVNGTVTATFP